MYNCNPYCNDTLGTYVRLLCEGTLGGGQNAILLLECNHGILDPSNATQVRAAINANRAYLIEGISFTIEAPTALTQDPMQACSTPTVVSYDRTGLYVNGNVSANNIDFHNGIFNGRSFGGIISYQCSEDQNGQNNVLWINSKVKLTGGYINPANLSGNEAQRFEATAAWRSLADPSMHVAPPGIFFE